MREVANWTSQPPLEAEEDGDTRIACDACAESVCAVCGHESCPHCLNDCDHADCLVMADGSERPRIGGGPLKKTHVCSFTPCDQHSVKR